MHDPDRPLHEELLHAAAAVGDQRAWQALYDECYEPLHRYIRWRLGGHGSSGDEVLQETWLTAVRLLDRFEPARGSFLQWLRGIAANAIRNHLRRETLRRRHSQPLETAAAHGAARANGARREAETDQSARIAAALAALPEHYEQVLRAKYVDGQSVAEIACDRNQTPKAVESLLTRAREAFREAYGRVSAKGASDLA